MSRKEEIQVIYIAPKCQEKRVIQVMPLLTNVKKRGKSRLCHCSQMSRKEGNPGYAIAHKCQEKREFRLCHCSQISRKKENPDLVIVHTCQEKSEIQVMPLLTNVMKRGKSRSLHTVSNLFTIHNLWILIEDVQILSHLQ